MPRTLKAALDRRIEAADSTFRGLSNSVRNSALSLLAVGLAQLVMIGVGLYVVRDANLTLSWAAKVAIAGDLLAAATMIACFFVASRAPVLALLVALTAWLAVQVATIAIGGVAAFAPQIGLGKMFTLAVLIIGLASAVRVRRLRARLVRPPLPSARVHAS